MMQEAVGTSGMDQLLGALQEEFGDLESEQASDSDDGQGSGTEQGVHQTISPLNSAPAFPLPPPSPRALLFIVVQGSL